MVGSGAAAGPVVVYFHGVPGGRLEAARFSDAAARAGVRLVCVARDEVAPGLTGPEYYRALAAAVAQGAAGAAYSLVGFSIGASAVLRTLPHLATPPSQIHLISAAAPLTPALLAGMAGRAVFQAAMRSDRALAQITAIQGMVARIAPGLLAGAIFATAAGDDRALAADRGFRAWIGSILAASLGAGAKGYVRDIAAYVEPWTPELGARAGAVQLWHGTQDNWSPPAMAGALQTVCGERARLTWLDGRSHYSTLLAAMPQVLAEVGGATPPKTLPPRS